MCSRNSENRSDHATFHVVFIHFERDEKKEAKRRRLKNASLQTWLIHMIKLFTRIPNLVLTQTKVFMILKYVYLKFLFFGQEKHPLEWLLDAQTWKPKLERIHRRFLTRHEVGSSASVGLKKWGSCTFMAFWGHNFGFSVLGKSNIGAKQHQYYF